MDVRAESPHPEDPDSARLPEKRYQLPKVVYEGRLEVGAGSPIGKQPEAGFLDPASPISLFRGE